MNRQTITDIVQKSDTAAGRAFDLLVIFLIVVSIILVSIETLPGLSPQVQQALRVSEAVITLLFTVEYVLRVVTAPRKTDYVLSFYGVIDLLAILPFYLSLGAVDLRILRIFRLFRVLRILKLFGYSRAMARFGKALVRAQYEISLFLFCTLIMIYLAAGGIYYFEHEVQPESFGSIFHCLWWAAETLTQVGYGDVYPVTTGGKLFTFAVMLCGVGIVAAPAGIIASTLSEVLHEERQEQALKATARPLPSER